jgi:hypothetical protein
VTAKECADTFLSGWVARFGVPRFITTYRGVQFTSATWAVMCSTLGAQHITTTAYHPQSNGLVERLHRQLKEALRSRNCGGKWLDHLSWVLLGVRATPKDLAGVSAAEAVYGAPLTLPGQLVRPPEPSERPLIPGTTPPPGEQAAPVVGSHVFVRRPGKSPTGPLFDGPFVVKEVKEKVLLVDFGTSQDWVSLERVKNYCGTDTPVPAVKKRHGRPRKK